MKIFQRDLNSPHNPEQGLPVETRIIAIAAAVASVLGLAIYGFTWTLSASTLQSLEGIPSYVTDLPMTTVGAFALVVAAIAWIYLRLPSYLSQKRMSTGEIRNPASSLEGKVIAIEKGLSNLQAQISTIYEKQTYLRATISALQKPNDEMRTELDTLKAGAEEFRARKEVMNRKLLDAVEKLAEGSLASLETQSVALQRLQEDFGLLKDKFEPHEIERDRQSAASQS